MILLGASWVTSFGQATSEKPRQRLTLIQYNECKMEQWNNSTERDPRGHLVQCPTQCMAYFKVLGQIVTIQSHCLKAVAFYYILLNLS